MAKVARIEPPTHQLWPWQLEELRLRIADRDVVVERERAVRLVRLEHDGQRGIVEEQRGLLDLGEESLALVEVAVGQRAGGRCEERPPRERGVARGTRK